MDIKGRILEYIKYKEIPIKQFEERSNLSNGYISSMRKGFGTEKLENVLSAFPDLSRDWLLYGEGSMLKKDQSRLNTDDLVNPLSINDLMKAINNLSEAAIVNANAAMKNAEANDRYSKNMERMLDMLSGNNIPDQKRDVKLKSPGIDEAV